MRNEKREFELMRRLWVDDTEAMRICAWDDHCQKVKSGGACPNPACRGAIKEPVKTCGSFYQVFAAYVN
jgi:hypothetical protein